MHFDIESRARPIIKWAGGKSGTLEQILPHFPKEFDRYVEPFLGSGAVFLALSISPLEDCPAFLNDSNPEIIHLYSVVRDNPDLLMAQLDELTAKYSEEFYYALRSTVPEGAIEKAARTLFLNKCGFNGLYRLNSKGDFNVPYGKRPKCPALYDRDNFLKVSKRLQSAILTSTDFEPLFTQAHAGDLIYCDPPYEPLSETSSFVSYTSNGFPRSEQERLKTLAEKAAQQGATVLISNSSAPFVLELFQGWERITISARRSINSKGNSRGAIPESLFVSLSV